MKSKKIKILHVLHAVGGVDISVRLIVKNLSSELFENIVLHGNNDSEAPYYDIESNEVKNYSIPIHREINLVNDLKAIIKTISVIKKEKPNLIHAHSAKGGVIAKIAAWYLNIPVLHTPQAFSFLSSSGFKNRMFKLIEYGLSLFQNNKILASSNSERIRAINDVGYAENRTILFNNSIEPIELKGEMDIDQNWPDNYIASVGRPSFQKNIELMIKVIYHVKKNIPDIHLVLMGVGLHSPNIDSVSKMIEQLNLETNVTLIKWTNQKDIFHILKKSKFYISTARYEGLPYSIIECLALEKAIIATNADGNRDLVKNNYNGFLIEGEDVKMFSEKIVDLWSNQSKVEKFAANSKLLFTKNFNIYNTIDTLQEIYIENSNAQ